MHGANQGCWSSMGGGRWIQWQCMGEGTPWMCRNWERVSQFGQGTVLDLCLYPVCVYAQSVSSDYQVRVHSLYLCMQTLGCYVMRDGSLNADINSGTLL